MQKKKKPAQRPVQVPPPSTLKIPKTPEEWKAHWEVLGQGWRTEPEIDEKRQEELAQRRVIVPDIKEGVYPFGTMKLSRADVEWLLATHENGCGPVDWSDEKQRNRKGLDLRGADLRGEGEKHFVDLTYLPLSQLIGTLSLDEWDNATEQKRSLAFVHLERSNLWRAHLEGAHLMEAHLEGADLSGANLQRADLTGIVLADEKYVGPRLVDVQWEGTNITVVEWSQITTLDDEYEAQRKRRRFGRKKQNFHRLNDYKTAVRAYRQLMVVLQAQGLNEDAFRFAYRAHVSQKAVFWFQMLQENIRLRTRISSLGNWLFSWFMFLIAGYSLLVTVYN